MTESGAPPDPLRDPTSPTRAAVKRFGLDRARRGHSDVVA